jgi:hypothetical protein
VGSDQAQAAKSPSAARCFKDIRSLTDFVEIVRNRVLLSDAGFASIRCAGEAGCRDSYGVEPSRGLRAEPYPSNHGIAARGVSQHTRTCRPPRSPLRRGRAASRLSYWHSDVPSAPRPAVARVAPARDCSISPVCSLTATHFSRISCSGSVISLFENSEAGGSAAPAAHNPWVPIASA